MSRIAVISPHADDAVFSVGEHMLSRPDDQFTIVCPCGVVPPFSPHREKYEILLAEHRVACERMSWDMINGPFLDDAAAPDAGGMSGLEDAVPLLRLWLSDVLQTASDDAFRDRFEEWWVPMGIHHPDHVAVRFASGGIGRPTARWCIYEELPYRVRWPQAVVSEQRWSHKLADLGPLGEQLDAKRRLCRIYSSQIGPDIERHLYADERLWR